MIARSVAPMVARTFKIMNRQRTLDHNAVHPLGQGRELPQPQPDRVYRQHYAQTHGHGNCAANAYQPQGRVFGWRVGCRSCTGDALCWGVLRRKGRQEGKGPNDVGMSRGGAIQAKPQGFVTRRAEYLRFDAGCCVRRKLQPCVQPSFHTD